MQQILDVWGEGRIVDATNNPAVTTGFTHAYNLNKVGQHISNGPHTGQPIPHLLPVTEYENPVFPVDDRSVPHITLMGAPITTGTAKEMCRVLTLPGTIYLYDPNEFDRRTFEAVSSEQGITLRGRFKPSELEPPFNEISLQAVYVYMSDPVPLVRPHLNT
ncbi:hypothetical protein [Pseudomonas sp. H9]|uniref:hypothetical protein n=1 Tax=Pseudomonas sp. H9 TaxID=483968 RepID=UPI001057E4BA|nr:hypothetical protein [Pseudomonas sp. H9]TDF86719.1 hypothetical protein E1573_00750 [Pseudomonas sp. H9]